MSYFDEYHKNSVDSKYRGMLGPAKVGLEMVIVDIEKRLRDLEHKTSKGNKRKTASRAQKMLLLFHLGMLDNLLDMPISADKKARLLSLIIDEDQANLKGDCLTIRTPKTDLRKEINYKFLSEIFNEVELEDQAIEVENILEKIEIEPKPKKK